MITTQHALGLDASHLCEAQDGHRLEKQTYDAFLLMQQAAKKDNVNINIASSYRDFHRQKFIWDQKWQGLRPLYAPNGSLLDNASLSEEKKLAAILTWSALPGASRHHWGTDLDIFDSHAIERSGKKLQLVPDEYSVNGPCGALSEWLVDHAEKFDFYLPYSFYNGGVSTEPWHISYQPVANKIQQLHTLDALQTVLAKEDISGRNYVLSRLPMIYHKYILNRGIDA
ncbi:M15 family metallopeptidase [Paraglaciecola sp. 20A4]|uniref:M15 family metallopeptidase n=1 Tax=Paraglaciecola sp. 20A4 TaxID=2687288 RepID=UPI001408B190|nr:M15 family metallopeptidase [Paraglaciecola sp. 20A4]